MSDLTIVYYTDNHLPLRFAGHVRDVLRQAAEEVDVEIVSVSQRELNFGRNVCIGQISRSFRSIIRQICVGALAAETKYIALAEHDVLYTPAHFTMRPQAAPVVFDQNRHRLLIDSGTFVPNVGGRSMQLVIAERQAMLADLVSKLERCWTDDEWHRQFEPGKGGLNLSYEMRPATGPGIIEICNHGYNYTKRHPQRGDLRSLPGWGSFERVYRMCFGELAA